MNTASDNPLVWLKRLAPLWTRSAAEPNFAFTAARPWTPVRRSSRWEACRDALLRFRLPIILILHVMAFMVIYALAHAIRFLPDAPPGMIETICITGPAIALLKLGIFVRMGSHRGWYRYATFADLVNLAEAATLAFIAVLALVLTARGAVSPEGEPANLLSLFAMRLAGVPVSVILLDYAGTILVLGGVRVSTRLYRERYAPIIASGDKPTEAVLVASASQAGSALVGQIRRQHHLRFKVLGILDSNPRLHGLNVGGVPVLGGMTDLAQLAKSKKIKKVLAPIPALSAQELRVLSEAGLEAGVKVQVVPDIEAVLNNDLMFQSRDVDIHDLLCRDPVRLETESIRRFLWGKRVLVTGAAGSIGSEICRQVLAFHPGELVLFDNSENGLFQIERELRQAHPGREITAIVGSIADEPRIQGVFARHRPQVVLHAAAYKHVPMMEANPGEAFKNNVIGTKIVVDEAIESGVESFVLISTDKAVNPSSVMGACKRLCELYLQASKEQARERGVRLVTVRFGNVLGSSGSVVPLFKQQIRDGGPVTVTHREMTRYFMTIPEASQLVLQAGAYGKGCEIFALDMGEPIRILDLAKDLIRLSGMRNIDIVFTGLRPGEKLHEELYHDDAEHLPTMHPKIFAVKPCKTGAEKRLNAEWDRLEQALHLPDPDIIALLEEFIPEYRAWPRVSSSLHMAG